MNSYYFQLSKIYSGYKDSWLKIGKLPRPFSNSNSFTLQISTGIYNLEKSVHFYNFRVDTEGPITMFKDPESPKIVGIDQQGVVWVHLRVGYHTSIRISDLSSDSKIYEMYDEMMLKEQVAKEPEQITYE